MPSFQAQQNFPLTPEVNLSVAQPQASIRSIRLFLPLQLPSLYRLILFSSLAQAPVQSRQPLAIHNATQIPA